MPTASQQAAPRATDDAASADSSQASAAASAASGSRTQSASATAGPAAAGGKGRAAPSQQRTGRSRTGDDGPRVYDHDLIRTDAQAQTLDKVRALLCALETHLSLLCPVSSFFVLACVLFRPPRPLRTYLQPEPSPETHLKFVHRTTVAEAEAQRERLLADTAKRTAPAARAEGSANAAAAQDDDDDDDWDPIRMRPKRPKSVDKPAAAEAAVLRRTR